MDIQQSIFSDPMYQMMQGRSGLAPDQYWKSLRPEAKKQHLSRINADPATYLSEAQYGNIQAVGANSGPNAFVSDDPVLAGYTGPSEDVSPALSASKDAMIVQAAPGILQSQQSQSPASNVSYEDPARQVDVVKVPSGYGDYSPKDYINAANSLNTTEVGSNHLGTYGDAAPAAEVSPDNNSYLEDADNETLAELASMGNAKAAAVLERRASNPQEPVEPALQRALRSQEDYSDPTEVRGANPALTQPVLTNSDGTEVGPDSGALVSTSNVNAAPNNSGNRTTNSTTQSTSRTVSPSTGNARGSQMGYGKANTAEMLMRVGGAMQAGAANGYGAAMGAASNEYGKIQDQRRAADTAAFEQAEDTRLKEEAMKAAAARARSSGGGKAAAAKSKALTGVNDAMYSMQRGLDAIADSRASGGNLTGVGGIFKGIFDNFTGDADANRRLILSRLKIDDTLLRTAETKGAISNVEMALFLEPAPKTFQDEQIWVDWLNERMRTLRAVQYRLQTGEELPLDQRSQKYDPSTGAPSNSSLSDDDMAYIK